MICHPWTADELALSERCLRDGVTMTEIAARLGRSFGSVASRLRVMSREIKAAKRPEPVYPTGFASALKQFPDYRDAAEWMGCSRVAAKTMAGRDWVPAKYWRGLLEGLNDGLSLGVTRAEVEGWAAARGVWTKTEITPCDWSDLPDMERRIAKIIHSKYKDAQLAEDAAGHAIMEMMERSKPYLGYGVRVAFCYAHNQRRYGIRHGYLTDEEVQAALDLTVWTPANQVDAVALREVERAAAMLPAHQKRVLASIVRGDTAAETAVMLGVTEGAASRERAHTRQMLRGYMDLAA